MVDYNALLHLDLTSKQEFFLDYIVKGAIGSIILFVALFSTKFIIFAIFPLLLAIGLAARIYAARVKSYERNLFVFLEDLKDLLQGGMNIVTAIEITTEHDYGSLNEPLKR
ncbi:MAG: hypothetical protein WCF78_00445, partial [archaeon]